MCPFEDNRSRLTIFKEVNMDKFDEIKRLRKEGLTIRAIAQRTDVPRSTVHKSLSRRSPSVDKDNGSVSPQMDKVSDGTLKYYFQLIHMPFTFRCPNCGLEQNHAFLCLLCGEFIPSNCKDAGCSAGFKFSEIVDGRQQPITSDGTMSTE